MNDNSTQTPSPISERQRLERNSFRISLVFVLLAMVATIAGAMGQGTNILTSIISLFVALFALFLSRRGNLIAANWILIVAGVIVFGGDILVARGASLYQAVTAAILISVIGVTAMPRRLTGPTLLVGLAVASVIILMDLFGSPARPPVSDAPVRLLITSVSLVLFLVFIAFEFPSFGLRTKITIGILGTGGLALAVLTFFAINRASALAGILSDRLETTVVLLAEEQLVNKVANEAEDSDRFFSDISVQIAQLSDLYINLQTQTQILGQGTYWNASERLLAFNDGKYGNSSRDISSVFIPSFVPLNESVIQNLNTSAYLDFSVPQVLNDYDALLAIYYIEPTGVVRYYPNIELASLLPPDFNATERPYYGISDPLFNPRRITRWTIPYVDATGAGLIVTAAHPIYINENFEGVVAADVQLATLTDRVSSITFGDTGYAFMLDDAGRIISMPPAGYQLFGIDPSEFNPDEFEKQTILGRGSPQLTSITRRMVAGATALDFVTSNGVDYYIGFSRIPSNGYSIAIVVPVSELQSAIPATRAETQMRTVEAVRTGALIVSILLVFAVLLSLGLGQVISRPVLRLTQTANQILEGDLSAQAEITSKDETGTLAQAFNAMTSRLRATFEGLERNIDERTAELKLANERNERRARQFQSIAQVARTISSTLVLENLLYQITNVISREFGFYHVGVFLLDTAGEYAVLSAANSDGGQTMLTRGHRLKVGEKGLVGFVSGTGRPRVALDTGADAIFFNNPDLPNTRSEIALPLRIGDTIIGVLDVQSTEPSAFSNEDVNILSTLAEQVSIAIQNARQNEQTQKALSESEALSRQFVQSGWRGFTKKQRILGIRHSGAKATLLYSNNGRGAGDDGSATSQIRAGKRGAVLSLPIKLRGETIGTVDVRSPGNRQWSQDEMDIVAAIIERAAIAMETARLLTESQRRAAKEQTIGEISARISAQREVEDLLKTAARELNRTLPGTEIAIQFRKEESE